MATIEPVVAAANELIGSITFDDSGVHGRGGNGGLISRETIRKADELRIALLRHEKMPPTVTEMVMVPRMPTDRMVIDGLMALVKEIASIDISGMTIVEGVSEADHKTIARLMMTCARMRNGQEVEACYRAMIDAALKEGGTS